MSRSQSVETMSDDQPPTPGSEIQLHPESYDETRIQGIKNNTPDSITYCSLVPDTQESGTATLEPGSHTEIHQTQNKECISSSYRDMELEIGGETIMIRGSKMTDMITS